MTCSKLPLLFLNPLPPSPSSLSFSVLPSFLILLHPTPSLILPSFPPSPLPPSYTCSLTARGPSHHVAMWLREHYPSRYYTVSPRKTCFNVEVPDLDKLCLMHCMLLCFCCQATTLDVSGQHVFVTRFVRPQNPPPALLPDQNVNRTPQLMVSKSISE